MQVEGGPDELQQERRPLVTGAVLMGPHRGVPPFIGTFLLHPAARNAEEKSGTLPNRMRLAFKYLTVSGGRRTDGPSGRSEQEPPQWR